jgi:choline-sulfatase
MKKDFLKIGLIAIAILGLIAFLSTYPLKHTEKNKDYNVVLVAFDGMQAKHLSAYGYQLDTTPNLDKFLDNSYLFKKAISPASWTVPTYMSIFTSLYPSEHKVVNKFVEYDKEGTTTKTFKANLRELNPQAVTLAEILKKNGYVTGGFTGDAGASGSFGNGLGFDEYFDKETFGGLETSILKAEEWLDKNKDKKFFMFLHGYDVHGQYAPKEGFDQRYVKKPYTGKYTGSPKEQGVLREEGLLNGKIELSEADTQFWRAIYDEKISRADAQFAKIMKRLEDLSLLKNTLVVVLSDHGTEFYEHKRFDHGHTLYKELVDVLFAVHMPGKIGKTEINSLVSTLDVAPTILSILGIKDPAVTDMKGIDLTPAFNGTDLSRDIYSETDYRLYTHKRSITTPDGWKFILTMENLNKELYDLNKDPGEQANLAEKETKLAYELEQKIYAHLKSMKSEGPWTIGCSQVYADQCLKPSETQKKN